MTVDDVVLYPLMRLTWKSLGTRRAIALKFSGSDCRSLRVKARFLSENPQNSCGFPETPGLDLCIRQ